MERIIIKTADGSDTVAVPDLDVYYHSKHGAVQESMHVFIDAGFRYLITQLINEPIRIFEMGFGTGLNALLTAIEAADKKIAVIYTTIEKYPLTENEIGLLNYTQTLNHADLYNNIQASEWNRESYINDFFTLKKIQGDLVNCLIEQKFNLIYYDAFAPTAQPELWSKEIFEKLFSMLIPGGILVTYCSKGEVRRAMKAAGFEVEKIPGPPGKREMVRATHPDTERKAIITQNQIV